jgi:hypothetical protein
MACIWTEFLQYILSYLYVLRALSTAVCRAMQQDAEIMAPMPSQAAVTAAQATTTTTSSLDGQDDEDFMVRGRSKVCVHMCGYWLWFYTCLADGEGYDYSLAGIRALHRAKQWPGGG